VSIKQAAQALQSAVVYKAKMTTLTDMKHRLIEQLDLESIDAGVGVDYEMLLSCLTRMCEYADTRRNRGQLRLLRGFRVKVGRYFGLADDGSVLLPWDWQLD